MGHKKEMKKRKKVILAVSMILAPCLCCGAIYLVLAFYYSNNFSYGTWINGVYCTGKSIVEVDSMLVEQTETPAITITDIWGQEERMNLEDITYTIDYKSQLEEFLRTQDSHLWIGHLFHEQNYNLNPEVLCTEELLLEKIEALAILQEDKEFPVGIVTIVKTEEGYCLEDTTEHLLNKEAAVAQIAAAIRAGNRNISLEEAGCYENIPKTEEMYETLALWDKVAAFQQWNLEYEIGEEIVPVDSAVVAEWIAVDEDGSFVLDESENLVVDEQAVAAFVSQLAKTYDTCGVSRTFRTTEGEDITIEGGTFGWQIDRKAETAYLLQACQEGRAETRRIPEYKKEALFEGSGEIGTTYIEINMTDQIMYYYEDGECMLETSIVTGNMKKNMATPPGVYYVYLKQKNRTLRGEDYATPVKFWMPVNGNIGIHDADWRRKFGGEIYKTNGSHGCVNTPPAVMKELYDMAEVGTPVVMYYKE